MSVLGHLQTLIVTVNLSTESIDKLKSLFKNVHHHPDGKVPKDVISKAEVWFSNWQGLPEVVSSIEDIPNLRLLQLSSGMCISYPDLTLLILHLSWRQRRLEAKDPARQKGDQADRSVQCFRSVSAASANRSGH
jgi:hypothetical protein